MDECSIGECLVPPLVSQNQIREGGGEPLQDGDPKGYCSEVWLALGVGSYC